MPYFISIGAGSPRKPAIVDAKSGHIICVASSPKDATTIVNIMNQSEEN